MSSNAPNGPTTAPDPRVKQLSDEAAANRVRAQAAEREAESLRLQLVAVKAEAQAEAARKENEALKEKLASLTATSDDEVLARGLENQTYFDEHRKEIDAILRRQHEAANKERLDAVNRWYNVTPGAGRGGAR